MDEEKYTYIGILEINGDPVYLVRDDAHLYTGITTNAGFAMIDEFEIDSDFSLDENIQRVVECL